jgi:amidase
MSTTHHLSRDHIVYSLDRQHLPALEVEPGDTVIFDTYDARTGSIRADSDLLDHAHPDGTNPATGPVWVNGAEPGDALVVDIMEIDLADAGFLAVKAGQGLLAHRASQYATRIVPVVDGMVHFGDTIRFPAQPMVGVLGTAPATEGVSTGLAGRHGGNMDNRLLGPGSRAYLPVAVEGALLGLGDVHAAMGDGEITFIGLEICATVTTRIQLRKAQAPARPIIETPDAWVTTADAEDLASAARLAAEEMVELMQARMGLTFEDAYMLSSAVVDVQICQCCEPGSFPVTARAVLSKQVMA